MYSTRLLSRSPISIRSRRFSRGCSSIILYAPKSGVYVTQLSCVIDGDIDIAAFRNAWQHVVDRHEVLRTTLCLLFPERPLQLVRPHAEVQLSRRDWQSITPEEQQRLLEALLEQDRREDFDFSQAPIMRLTLIQAAPRQFYFYLQLLPHARWICRCRRYSRISSPPMRR